jgi:hypothetical protein
LESAAQYGYRLRRALDDWFYAGSARAIMAQAIGFLTPVSPRTTVVSQSSVWDVYADGAQLPIPPAALVAPTHTDNSLTPNWNWDGTNFSARWFRAWLIIRNAGTASGLTWTAKGPAYGTFAATGWKWGDHSRSWGLSVPAGVITGIRNISKLWKRKGSTVLWIIVSFDATYFVASDAPGAGTEPDGKWGPWHKSTTLGDGRIVAVASRLPNARYCTGVT